MRPALPPTDPASPTVAERPRRALRLLRGLLLSALVLALCLAALEVGLRMAGYARGPAQYFDPRIGYRFHPSQVRQVVGEDGSSSMPVRLNALGYRGPAPRAPGAFEGVRVACLGDSFTFGWGVADGEEYPAQLDRELRARLPGAALEVSNFGVPGYNVWNSARTYTHVVRPFAPRVVVFGFFGNDLEPRVEGPSYTSRPLVRLVGSSALFEAFHRHLRPRTPFFGGSGSPESREFRRRYFALKPQIEELPDSEVARPYWEALLGDLEDLAREVRGDGAELLVIAFPMSRQVTGARAALAAGTERTRALEENSVPQRHLAEALVTLGVPYLDLLPTFVDSGPVTFSPLSPGHPGPDALRDTARVLAEELVRGGWLEPVGGRAR